MATDKINSISIQQVRLVLIILYAVGLAGIILLPQYFLPLTPFNLLISLASLLIFAPLKNSHYIRFVIAVLVLGFAIELIGVKTGRIFGSYYYGESLGLKISGIPLIIGINWAILTLATLSVTQQIAGNDLFKMLAGASLMTGMDALIEPLCANLDFWYWSDHAPPARNFVAWFIVSLFFHGLARSLRFEVQNAMAAFLFLTQAVFFAILNLVNKFL